MMTWTEKLEKFTWEEVWKTIRTMKQHKLDCGPAMVQTQLLKIYITLREKYDEEGGDDLGETLANLVDLGKLTSFGATFSLTDAYLDYKAEQQGETND